ncbi:MAG TPA: ABC transporter ATP-binding protein [Candidatus Korarchaeota archaeon]|nr:ABC transporter ATP-binding protein [Candidatus Korarchaeota archaeon]
MPEIELVNIRKTYGRIIAIDRVNLHVNDGEYMAVIGPSGCGKSTLLKVISGIVEPDEGDVLVDGESILGKPPEERNIGFIFQDLALFPHMNGFENAGYGLRVREWDPRDADHEVLELAREFGFNVELARFPEEMSSGEQQQVALLRAIAYGAKILLLDEPLSAIDRKVSEEVREKLRRIVKSKGLTALHVTHNQEEAMAVADRIAVMRRGRFVQVGTPQELYYNPLTPFVMAFVGDASFLVGRTENGKVVVRGGYEIGPSNLPEGELLVVGIRPENVVFGTGIPGRIRLRSYLGAFLRYEIELVNGDVIIAVTEEELEGKDVKVWFSGYKLFRFPEEGLSEAILPG